MALVGEGHKCVDRGQEFVKCSVGGIEIVFSDVFPYGVNVAPASA